MGSAWTSKARAIFGQLAVSEKSNEITAAPILLELLDIEGAIITADAMSCQKEIAATITKKGADYTIGLKDNQRSLSQAAQEHFETALSNPRLFASITKVTTKEIEHERNEVRTYYLCSDSDFLKLYRSDWRNLNGIGMMVSRIEKDEIIAEEKRYHITIGCGRVC